jgi:hypothetical protein
MRNIIWAQDLLNRTIYDGDISPLDNLITIDQLSNFSSSDLRLLRNTIYAKYGYKFNSIDLQNHFSQFLWYNGMITNADDLLTLIDRQNIELIQRIEKNYPENNISTSELIGNWYNFTGASSEGIDSFAQIKNRRDLVQIMPNGIYIYYILVDVRFSGTLYGLWSLKNNIFETIPIGDHLVHFLSPGNNIDEYMLYLFPTYGKVENFRTSVSQLNDGSRHLHCELFNNRSWYKE